MHPDPALAPRDGSSRKPARPRHDAGDRFGSDLIVDLLVQNEIAHLAMNPGASFRGLHDSLVQRADAPELIICTHEKVAVNVAHGYAKVTGRPMGVVLHDVVGLLHGSMGILYAYTDRVPVLVLGGSGPMDTARRRPEIDWRHTANIQGNAIRDFTKWDDQPASVAAFSEAVHRALRVAVTEPAGPTYVAIDADLQEQRLADDLAQSSERPHAATPIGPDPEAMDRAARALVAAERPILLCGYAGRDPAAFEQIPRLAELVGAGIFDTGVRLNAPNRHPYNVTGSAALEEADLVLALDMKDMSKFIRSADPIARTSKMRLAPDTKLIDIGFGDLHASAWIHHHGPLQQMDLAVLADTRLALPALIERCGSFAADGAGVVDRAPWRRRLIDLHEQTQAAWRRAASERATERPVAPPQLVSAVWNAIKDLDWVLTAGTADWATRLWDMDQPYRHPGGSLGTATQIGISLGVALAHRGSGRLVVDLQPDGDLLYDPGALWTAAANRLPLLVVMFNNRAYYNDWNHQIEVARHRGRPLERADVGVAISEPAPDFATMARSLGWHAEETVTDPDGIEGAVRRAAKVVLDRGQPALVDVVCQHR